MQIEFEWHPKKNRDNIRKHGIDFETAKLIFDGLVYTEEDYRFEYGEIRFRTLGRLPNAVILVVIHIDFDDNGAYTVRIISARFAKKHEEREYYENI
jgi:hypothetical protein